MERIWTKHKQLNTTLKPKVFVAMSGGVDSSVAAWLLKKQGYSVAGVFMKCWTGSSARIHTDFYGDPRGTLEECGWEKDAEDARRVAEKIGIPFYVWDFEKEYKRRVVDYMVEGYRQGITPNPDVMCNREVKFGLFLDRALKLGADYVATGHYVRLRRVRDPKLRIYPNDANKHIRDIRINSDFSDRLFQAKDKNKDQSYFLWMLTQEKLRHCLFPIGEYLKSEVREIARRAGLPTAEKKDSQGICFLGKVRLANFLAQYIPERKGAVVTTAGEKIGEHKGAYFYTIGQRHLNISNLKTQKVKVNSDQKPFYVAEKDVATNILVVAEGENHRALYTKDVVLTDVNFINPATISLIRANGGMKRNGLEVLARVRYRQPLMKAKIMNKKSRIKGDSKIHNSKFIILTFDTPVKFAAPGQSAVFYKRHGSRVKGQEEYGMLGGGIIAKH